MFKQNIHIFTLSVVSFLMIVSVAAQSTYIPLNSYSIHLLDRMEIKQGRLATPEEFNTTTKAYLRKNIAEYSDSFSTESVNWSKQDQFNLEYLQNDNFEFSNSTSTASIKHIGKTSLYKHKAALYDVKIPDFTLVVSPVLYLKPEYDQQVSNQFSYLINRGIEIRGTLGKSIGFYTQAGEEIQKMNTWNLGYYREHGVIPGQNVVLTANFTLGENPVFSYWSGSGYIVYKPVKFWDFQLGHGQNSIGDGYRSFMRSNFASNNLFARSNVRIWKINYTNIWGNLYDYSNGYNQAINRYTFIKRHYYATTYANVNITKNLNLGLFETTVFQRDSGFEKRGYDLQYINPVIFYNLIEDGLHSPDKNILGLNFKYNFLRHFSLYGQFVLSELNFKQRFSGNGWWGNKEAYQLGVKYIDVFGVNNLDIQLEYNQAAPYSYTSYDTRNAYLNYNQSMAHPIGANFREGIFIIHYQPINKLMLSSMCFYSVFGNDSTGTNWGKNIGMNYETRMRDYGNYIGQGYRTTLFIGNFIASYMFKHNLFFDLQVTYRNQESELSWYNSQTVNMSLALRWNIGMRHCNY